MALSKFHRWRCELANTMFLRVPQQNLPKYFGHVSVLQTNLAKSSASPIHCSENDLLLTSEIMSCPVKEFPCTYLGLPLSLRKPTNTEFLPLIEKVAHCWYSISLHRWAASSPTHSQTHSARGGRRGWAQHTHRARTAALLLWNVAQLNWIFHCLDVEYIQLLSTIQGTLVHLLQCPLGHGWNQL